MDYCNWLSVHCNLQKSKEEYLYKYREGEKIVDISTWNIKTIIMTI